MPHFFNSFMTEVYHTETNPLTCRANQWTGFYMIWTSGKKELRDQCQRNIRSYQRLINGKGPLTSRDQNIQYTQFFYKQPVYNKLALEWQIAKQLPGLISLSLCKNKNYRFKKSEDFPL